VVLATGHDVEGGKPSRSDWSRIAAGAGTLVLFMAAQKLGANLARLVACGRPADTPAALISAGTMPEQQVVVGTLATLAERVAALDLAGPPALVVVGEVVRLREQLAWFERAQERT
jgi:uroporphyrinogen III methyltransferase/synthase